ncbi:MAG: DnaD domain protein [Solobacterium sp.]|nr:DnaD domain protein [Solobacterium sp.]
MNLKPKDVYRIETGADLSEEMISSLLTFYLPLVGNDAVLLYLFLHSEGRMAKTNEPHSRISVHLNRSMDEIERARAHLEEYLLVRTWVNENETRNSYIYRLNTPLPPESFLASNEFLSAYRRAVDNRHADASVSRIESRALPLSGYRDITLSVRHKPLERELLENENAAGSKPVRPSYRFTEDEQDIRFDYEKFLSLEHDLWFPNILRTSENMALIGRLATFYGLSPETMVRLVGDSITLFSGEKTLNTQLLERKAARAKTELTEAKDPYALSPVSFLMSKQNGTPVTQADKRILEKLAKEMQFPDEVINVMIEYILELSDNQLNSRFVDMVAGEWARDGVANREDAFKERKKKTRRSSSRKIDQLPAYYNANPRRTSEKQTMSEEEVRRATELLKSRGKGKTDG